MRIASLNDVARRPRRVAIGNFDGVHLGHQQVIAGNDTVLTFDPHPLSVVRPDAAPPLLNDRALKMSRLRALGVEETVVIPFDRQFASLSADAFIDEILVGRLDAVEVSVGENFRFGARGAGDARILAADARFQTRRVPLLPVDGRTVSSTRIRSLVAAGDVVTAGRLLGCAFELSARPVAEVESPEYDVRSFALSLDERLVRPHVGTYACAADGLPAAVVVTDMGLTLLIERSLLPPNGDALSGELRVQFMATPTAPGGSACWAGDPMAVELLGAS